MGKDCSRTAQDSPAEERSFARKGRRQGGIAGDRRGGDWVKNRSTNQGSRGEGILQRRKESTEFSRPTENAL